jgi:hypothetical protein
MIERTFEIGAPPFLDLRVPSGSIEIEATDTEATEIRVDGPQELLDRATVEQRGDTVVVDAEGVRNWLSWRGRGLHVEVRCPHGSALATRSKSTDVTARGTLRSAEVATASGDVDLDEVSGDVNAKSASGDVSVRRVGGSLAANSASGDVVVGSVGGRLKANSVSGDVRVELASGDVEANSVSGDVALREVVQGSVYANAVSGDVEVGVRRGSRVHVDASTLSGDTSSDLDFGGEAAAGEGPVVELRIKTVSGDIAVVRASAPDPQEVQQ